jgi:hypothetical protein
LPQQKSTPGQLTLFAGGTYNVPLRPLFVSLSLLFVAAFMMSAPLAVAQAPPCPAGEANVTTQHNDTCRTGWQQYESKLSPSTVSQSTFGLLWQYPVYGAVFAQPLVYHTQESIGTENTCSNCDVVFIADEMDYVYAFEADSPASSETPLWSVDVAVYPITEWSCITIILPCNKGVVGPYMGITGTPVIDEANKIIYVVALEDVSGAPEYFLVATNLLDGVVLASLQIQPTFPGVNPDNSCTTAVGSGTVSFAPADSIQRPGLLLLGNSYGTYGTVYVGFAPAETGEWSNGWLLGYQYTSSGSTGSLAQAFALNTTPYGTGGGVWMGGSGLVAADATVGGTNATYIFASTGQGTFDFDSPKNNFADSLLRLTPGLTISDYFTPADEFSYYVEGDAHHGRCLNDLDLNSYGLIALPDETPPLMSAHPRLIVAADKEAKLYVVDRDSLTEYSLPTDRIVQEIQTPPIANVWGYWGYPAYYKWTDLQGVHRALYYSPRESATTLPPLPINQYTLTPTGPIPVWSSVLSSPEIYCSFGPAPSVSSDGSTGGILWTIEATNFWNSQGADNPNCQSGTNEPGTYYLYLALHAYDATNISSELYNGRGHNGSPATGYPVTFGTPTIYNGKVFVGARDATNTSGIVDVWGLCSESPSGCLE